MAEPLQFDRTAATAHARLDGHEKLCVQNAEHTQKALQTLTDAIKALTEMMSATNVGLHSRIDRLMYGVAGILLSVAGGAIFLLSQWLFEVVRYGK